MKPYVLPLADSQAVLETVGGKGMSLAKMAQAGLRFDGSFIVDDQVHRFKAAGDSDANSWYSIHNFNGLLGFTKRKAAQLQVVAGQFN